MKIKLESRNGFNKILTCVALIKKVLDLIEGDEISGEHYPLILKHYTLTSTFTTSAVKYGMLIKIQGESRQPNAIWAKTHNEPEFVVPEPSAEQLLQIANKGKGRGTRRVKPADDSAHAWNGSPRKPSQRKAKAASEDSQRQVKTYSNAKQRAHAVKSSAKQGDGSVLKPKFNHEISPSEPRKNYDRTERYQPSRLSIMNQIEDIDGYAHYWQQPSSNSRIHSARRY